MSQEIGGPGRMGVERPSAREVAVSGVPDPVVECTDIYQDFRVRRRGSLRMATVSAVAGVSFSIGRGELLAIVGETGSGKSTLARCIIGAPPPVRGRVVVSGHELTGAGRSASAEIGRLVQMIFQDPMSALDPKWTVERIVAEPLAISGQVRGLLRRRHVAEVLDLVGLPASRFANRSPPSSPGGRHSEWRSLELWSLRPSS